MRNEFFDSAFESLWAVASRHYSRGRSKLKEYLSARSAGRGWRCGRCEDHDQLELRLAISHHLEDGIALGTAR